MGLMDWLCGGAPGQQIAAVQERDGTKAVDDPVEALVGLRLTRDECEWVMEVAPRNTDPNASCAWYVRRASYMDDGRLSAFYVASHVQVPSARAAAIAEGCAWLEAQYTKLHPNPLLTSPPDERAEYARLKAKYEPETPKDGG